MNTRSPKKVSVEQAKARLEAMCARAEHATRELRDKLWQWGITPTESDAIIADLTERRFVDDARFARAFVNDKINFARWGRRKIYMGLRTKHIASEIITEVLEEGYDEDIYVENLRSILASKARTITEPRTFDGRTKLFRYGISRGYEPELVAKIIKEFYI